jgi:hypothetical protein
MILVFNVFSATSLAGQTAMPVVSEIVSLIFAWSAMMQP